MPTPAKVKSGSFFTTQSVNPLDSLTLCPHDKTKSDEEGKEVTQSRGLSNDITGGKIFLNYYFSFNPGRSFSV